MIHKQACSENKVCLWHLC